MHITELEELLNEGTLRRSGLDEAEEHVPSASTIITIVDTSITISSLFLQNNPSTKYVLTTRPNERSVALLWGHIDR